MEYKLKKHKIVLEDGNEEKGVITWEDSIAEEDVMYVTHTIVDPSIQGKSIAQELLDKAADYARDNNKKIVPVCSYAQKKFDNTNNYNDVYCTKIDPKTFVCHPYVKETE